MLGEDQLEIDPPGLPDPGGIGADHHALGHLVVTGRHQPGDALDLHHTDPAGRDLIDVLEVAEAGDVDAVGPSGLQNGRALGGRDHLAVNCQSYHLSILPPLKLP